LVVSYVPIDELRQAPRRVRRANAEQVARIRASIEKFGVCQPILISKDRTIVHGHARCMLSNLPSDTFPAKRTGEDSAPPVPGALVSEG
jgi:ParB-like chromosome segregation protein Spo0J